MTAENELLPLPSGNVAHLIAAQAAEIEALRESLAALKADNEKLREALKDAEVKQGEVK
jgi:cell shape-determining protein MreC